jgi:hypothetical protein
MTEVSNFHSNMRPSLAALAILAIVSQLAPSACVAHGFIRSSNQATYVGISTASRHQSEHEIESLTGIGVQFRSKVWQTGKRHIRSSIPRVLLGLKSKWIITSGTSGSFQHAQ